MIVFSDFQERDDVDENMTLQTWQDRSVIKLKPRRNFKRYTPSDYEKRKKARAEEVEEEEEEEDEEDEEEEEEDVQPQRGRGGRGKGRRL